MNQTLQIPAFSEDNTYLRSHDYRILLREPGEAWQPITPYSVRINHNVQQNIALSDPVKHSPMIYFSMGERPVEILLEKADGAIWTAEVLPADAGSTVRVEGGKAVLTVPSPQNLCVRINRERYELVYIFANSPEEMPKGAEDILVIPPGHTEAEFVGTGVWNGAIRDVRLYRRCLSPEEIRSLATGGEADGYTYRWALNGSLEEENGHGAPSLLGKPTLAADYHGAPGLVFDGLRDRFATGTELPLEWAEAYSISVWVYQEGGAPRSCQILQELLHVYADGTVCSNIGRWEFPYRSRNRLLPDGWRHLTLVKDGNDVTVYIDGESGGTETREPQTRGYGLIIGAGDVQQGLYLRDNQTLYLSPGAVLHGTVIIAGARHVRVCGSGIIDITPQGEQQTCYNGICISNARDVEISGIIVNNPRFFSVRTLYSENIVWNNVKIFSSYGPSDGCNIAGSRQVTVENCFIRCNDDGFSIADHTDGVIIRDCILINDAAHGFLISSAENVRVENLDILDSKQPDFGYQGVFGLCADNGSAVRNITFREIRVGEFLHNKLFEICVMFNPIYSQEPGRVVENITFDNVVYNGFGHLPSSIRGYDGERCVRGVHFRGVTINGKALEEEDGVVKVGDGAEDVTFG